MRKEFLEDYEELINLVDVYSKKTEKKIADFQKIDNNISNFFQFPKKNEYFSFLISELAKIKKKAKEFKIKFETVQNMDKETFSKFKKETTAVKEYLLTADDILNNPKEQLKTFEDYKNNIILSWNDEFNFEKWFIQKIKLDEISEVIKKTPENIFNKNKLAKLKKKNIDLSTKLKEEKNKFKNLNKKDYEKSKEYLLEMVACFQKKEVTRLEKKANRIKCEWLPILDRIEEFAIDNDQKQVENQKDVSKNR